MFNFLRRIAEKDLLKVYFYPGDTQTILTRKKEIHFLIPVP